MYNENKRQQKFGFKVLILLASVSMIIGLAVGGTMAWLTDKTSEVKNTFTTSDINITLDESNDLDLKMIPGHTIKKDPKVTVKANSEDCFVFVKLVKSDNYGTFLNDYAIADGWTELEDAATDGKVYYRIVSQDTTQDQAFEVLKDNQVTVKWDLTKETMNTIGAATNPAPNPTLTITAFACQQYKSAGNAFNASEAWDSVTNSGTKPDPNQTPSDPPTT